MNERPLSLQRYGISRERYEELKWFCRQYPQKQQRLRQVTLFLSSPVTGMPHSSHISKPVEAAVLKREQMDGDCALIENAAQQANATLAPFLIRCVCYGEGYVKLQPPCGINQFSRARSRFFCLLHEAKEG